MEMVDTVVHLKAGDVLVQRGTIHNWVNNGTAPCVIAFVLISSIGQKPLGKNALRRARSASGAMTLKGDRACVICYSGPGLVGCTTV